ncbi:hypothetical protein ABTD48_19790, partial [Acinetobacter baumannii]
VLGVAGTVGAATGGTTGATTIGVVVLLVGVETVGATVCAAGNDPPFKGWPLLPKGRASSADERIGAEETTAPPSGGVTR